MNRTFLLIFSLFFTFFSTAKASFVVGWSEWRPYQFSSKNQVAVEGLDIEFLKSIGNQSFVFKQITFEDQLKGIKNGTLSLMAGVTQTHEREAVGYFTIPYRHEMNSLFILAEDHKKYPIRTVEDFLNLLEQKTFRLGVPKGFVFGDSRINSTIYNSHFRAQLTEVESEREAIELLLDRKIDGVLTDRFSGLFVVSSLEAAGLVRDIYFGVKVPVSFFLSKKRVSEKDVNALNKEIERNKTFAELAAQYVLPCFLQNTLATDWFVWIDILGVLAFAFSGVFLAYREGFGLLGALFLAILPACTGGMMRDLLTNRHPIAFLKSPLYLMCVLFAVGLGYVCISFFDKHLKERHILSRVSLKIINICDALGLSAFIVVGVTVSVMQHVKPLWLWGPFFALLTAVGGGIIRDLFRSDSSFPLLKEEFYGEIAVLWGGFLSFFLLFQAERLDPDETFWGILITLGGAFLTRLLAMHFNLKSLAFGWKRSRSNTKPF